MSTCENSVGSKFGAALDHPNTQTCDTCGAAFCDLCREAIIGRMDRCPRCHGFIGNDPPASWEVAVGSEGRKDDKGKLQWHLLPWGAAREVVKVLVRGAAKYAPNNWKLVPEWRDRYFDAAIRHLVDWREGQRCDPEWGLHHLAHAACCVLFMLSLDLPGKPDPHPYPTEAPNYWSDP